MALSIVMAETLPVVAVLAVSAETRGAGARPCLDSGEVTCVLASLMGVMGFIVSFGVPGSSSICAPLPKGLRSLELSLVVGRSHALPPGMRFVIGALAMAMDLLVC